MDEVKRVPTQDELDACPNMGAKFALKPPEQFYELNERGMSRCFAETIHTHFIFNATQNVWMYYDGRRWQEDTGGIHIQSKMKEFSFELLKYAVNNAGGEDDSFLTFVQSLGKSSKRKSLIKDAIDYFVVTDDDFDRDKYLLNLQNGTFNLQTGVLQPHNPKDMLTKIANVHYCDTATNSPDLDKFMDDIFCGDTELINYIYRVLGHSLTGQCNQDCLFICLGETTRNGKSTLLNTFAYLMGDYAKNADVSTFAQKKNVNGSAPSSDICRLRDARFVVASEPAPDFTFDESKVKAFTGGDSITARMLYHNDVQFQPTFKIFIGTNHRPNVADDTLLESNRLRVIPFNRHFEIDEQDRDLKRRLCSPLNLAALLNKCISGFAEFMRTGLNEPTAVIEATAAYQTQGRIFEVFINSQLQKEQGANTSLAMFYPLYAAWCTENGCIPMTRDRVNTVLRRKGLYKATATIGNKTVRNILSGYRLKTKEDTVPPVTVQCPLQET